LVGEVRIRMRVLTRIVCLALITSCHPAGTDMKAKDQERKVAPYGAWESPLTAASIFESSDHVLSLSANSVSKEDASLYFLESRAANNGKNILAKLYNNRKVTTLTDPDLSVRSRVHEYGGRSYLVAGDTIFYSNFEDQKIYKISDRQNPVPLTPEGLRYMACIADTGHNQIICVREDHRQSGEAVNTLVAIDTEAGGEGKIIFEGTDFVSDPVLSADGKSLAFVTWSHPNMPWDDTELRVAQLGEDGAVNSISEVRGPSKTAFREPFYSPDGILYFTAEWTDWQVLYRVDEEGNPELVSDQQVEMTSFSFENDQSIVLFYFSEGSYHLARLDLKSSQMKNIGQEFSSAGALTTVGSEIYFIASTPASKFSIYQLKDDGYQLVYQPGGPKVEPAYLSSPEAITYPTGDQNKEEAYGFFYAPRNVDFEGPEGTLPPLIVKVHGGPVGKTTSTFDPSIQFWTSRGFAVFDVNHRGSTGYGRTFRKKLYPNWGIVDIEDVANGTKWLVDNHLVDGSKLAIRGGSAGGYTVLASLAFTDVFKAGASYFGVSDLELLATDTHKFESRYLDQLIGVYPDEKATYDERSPIHSVDNIVAPLLILQGLDDKVVPPNQSESIFEALKKNCIPTAYITFEGEGHGFRQPANNIKALNSELGFYGEIFGFEPAGNPEGIELVRCEQE
jgi:dipeptidyl aminopeptidase/acylaminoacyl peptidase